MPMSTLIIKYPYDKMHEFTRTMNCKNYKKYSMQTFQTLTRYA